MHSYFIYRDEYAGNGAMRRDFTPQNNNPKNNLFLKGPIVILPHTTYVQIPKFKYRFILSFNSKYSM